jgi:hypothetical protein
LREEVSPCLTSLTDSDAIGSRGSRVIISDGEKGATTSTGAFLLQGVVILLGVEYVGRGRGRGGGDAWELAREQNCLSGVCIMERKHTKGCHCHT